MIDCRRSRACCGWRCSGWYPEARGAGVPSAVLTLSRNTLLASTSNRSVGLLITSPYEEPVLESKVDPVAGRRAAGGGDK